MLNDNTDALVFEATRENLKDTLSSQGIVDGTHLSANEKGVLLIQTVTVPKAFNKQRTLKSWEIYYR